MRDDFTFYRTSFRLYFGTFVSPCGFLCFLLNCYICIDLLHKHTTTLVTMENPVEPQVSEVDILSLISWFLPAWRSLIYWLNAGRIQPGARTAEHPDWYHTEEHGGLSLLSIHDLLNGYWRSSRFNWKWHIIYGCTVYIFTRNILVDTARESRWYTAERSPNSEIQSSRTEGRHRYEPGQAITDWSAGNTRVKEKKDSTAWRENRCATISKQNVHTW